MQMVSRRTVQRIASAVILSTLAMSTAATAGNNIVDRWNNREIKGPYASAKSSLALEWCVARQMPFPTVIHGEQITELNSLWAQQGVRIADNGKERAVTFVANPRTNDHTTAMIQGCI